MKFKRCLCIGLIGVSLFGSTISANAEVSSKDKQSYTKDFSTDDLKISLSKDSEDAFQLNIKNLDKYVEIKDVVLAVPTDERLVIDNNLKRYGNLKPGESKTLKVTTKNVGTGLIKKYISEMGGYNIVILNIAISVGTGYYIYLLLKNKNKNTRLVIGLSSVVILICAGSLYFINFLPTDSESLDLKGFRYSREIVLSEDPKENLSAILYYSIDATEEKSETEESIKYKTTYRYNSELPCTDKPIVVQEGKNGKKLVSTNKLVSSEGKIYNSTKKEIIIQEPTERVLEQGTKPVVELEKIEADKYYIPDKTMNVGEYKLYTDLEESKGNIGEKEVSYHWNEKEKKVVSKEKVIKKQGVNTWKAGSLLEEIDVIKAKTKYKPVDDKPVGWVNTVKESKDGYKKSIYEVKIDSKTGKPVKNGSKKYLKTEKENSINGIEEVGVLSVVEEVEKFSTTYQYDDTKWEIEELELTPGKDKIERVSRVMKLDKTSGTVTGEIDREISRELIQESCQRVVSKGTKIPEWVEEKIANDQVQFNTIYKEDKSLKGETQVVERKGEFGRLITTQLVAVNENGDKLDIYKPRVLKEDELVKPVDEIIRVSSESNLLKK